MYVGGGAGDVLLPYVCRSGPDIYVGGGGGAGGDLSSYECRGVNESGGPGIYVCGG